MLLKIPCDDSYYYKYGSTSGLKHFTCRVGVYYISLMLVDLLAYTGNICDCLFLQFCVWKLNSRTTWTIIALFFRITCDDEEERASRRVYRGCSRSPTCKGCTSCVCFGCEICRFSDCSCQTCTDFTRNAKVWVTNSKMVPDIFPFILWVIHAQYCLAPFFFSGFKKKKKKGKERAREGEWEREREGKEELPVTCSFIIICQTLNFQSLISIMLLSSTGLKPI